MNRVYLLLGSNIEPEKNLPKAVTLLRAIGAVQKTSSVYETEPVGGGNQPNFLNAAVLFETKRTAAELRDQSIREIEKTLNRVRSQDRNAPRTIDIDISLFNRDRFHIGDKEIPDPDILRFAHVAVPLGELDPGYEHPVTGKTLAEIAKKVGKNIEMRIRGDVTL